jgi:hypothetical protein
LPNVNDFAEDDVFRHTKRHPRATLSSKVDRQTLVDEHPEVVVAAEAESLASLMQELSMDLDGEVAIVVCATPRGGAILRLVAEELAVDREELLAFVQVDVGVDGTTCDERWWPAPVLGSVGCLPLPQEQESPS